MAKVAILLLIACVTAPLALADFVPRMWVVDLDRPAESRWPWASMVPLYNDTVHAALAMIGQFVPPKLQPEVEAGALLALPHLGDYAGEIRSASTAFGIRLADAVLLNIIYEVEAGCTSIIANDPNGTILHGRNLDFNLAPLLRNLTIHVDFQSGGKTVYRGTTYTGYIGLLTGMRPGSFSISVDERDTGYLIQNLLEALFVRGTYVAALLIRDTLLQDTEFDVAVQRLAYTSLAAPIYLIVGGASFNQGAIITRDRDGPADIWLLNQTAGRWWEVETNDDHWKPPKDSRRETANNGMKAIGYQNVSLPGIYTVLSTPKVINSMTTYTTLMSAASDTYEVVVRTFA